MSNETEKAQRRASFAKIFELFCSKQGSKFNPDALVKFYAIANNPLSYGEASIVFSRFIEDSKANKLKQLSRDGFIECMEATVDKINKNSENVDIKSEILDYSHEFFTQNKDTMINLLNLPPDLTKDELNQLLIALSSEEFSNI